MAPWKMHTCLLDNFDAWATRQRDGLMGHSLALSPDADAKWPGNSAIYNVDHGDGDLALKDKVCV